MASTKQRAVAVIESMGCTYEVGGGRHFEVCVEAPAGSIFAGAMLHGVVFAGWDDDKAADVWARVLEELSAERVEPCTEADCDTCAE